MEQYMENTIKSELVRLGDFNRCIEETKMLDIDGVKFNVTPTLSLIDAMKFVNAVVSLCISEDTLTEEYTPEIKDFAIKYHALMMYTDISVPADLPEAYELIYTTNVADAVIRAVNEHQWYTLISSVDKKIEKVIQTNIAAINKEISNIYNAFENLEAQIGGFFNNMSSEDLNALLSAVSNGELDEKKIVEAYIAHNKESK